MTTQSNKNSKFSAAPVLIGYMYQCRYALLESLYRLSRCEEFLVSIETLDDVVFETNGEPPDLIQTKHHVNQTADLTDASPDLWRTIRIWCEGKKEGSIPDGSALFLVTTAIAPEGSAAFYLKLGENRDVSKAVERLNATSESSTSQTNSAGYNAFRSLTLNEKSQLAESISILDSVPAIADLDSVLKEVVYFAAPNQYLDSFLQRLEGWWFRRAIQHLSGRNVSPILSEELEAETARLREQFKQDNLPIDDDIMSAIVDESAYQDMTFVHQLRLIEIGNPRIFHAIRNYFRAFEHRSRWVREDLLYVGELDRYEDRLIEEWDILFQQMREELGDKAMEVDKKRKAQTLYRWVETGMHLPIRQGITEPSIARGTYQILADRELVGWHPEFAARLRKILESREASL